MENSPFQTYLQNNLPLASKPWIVSGLRQDKVVCQAASNLLNFDLSNSRNSPEDSLQLEDWSPAALALRYIAPSLSTKWLRISPMPDLDDETKRNAFLIANSTTLPTDDWSIDKAGWLALAIRSDYLAKGSWQPVLDTWLSDPEEQYGTVLACLYGILSDPLELFHEIIRRNPSAQNIALVLHALLANPLPPEDLYQHLIELSNSKDGDIKLSTSVRLVFLHILQSQRPQLAPQIARYWLDNIAQFPTKVGWTNQDPLTWFHDLEGELFQAVSRQIIALEPSSVAMINAWKKLSFSPSPEQPGISILSDLITEARSQQSANPQQALHYGQKASQYLAELLKKIPNLLLADTRLVPQMQDLSELLLALGRPFDSDAVLGLACELQPTNPTLLIMNARSKQKSGKANEAVQALATALILAPSHIDISAQLADAIEIAGQWQTALSLRQALLDESLTNNRSDTIQERYALAKCALQAGLPEKALEVGEQLIQINPKDGMGHYYCGQAFINMGKLAEAEDKLIKATELSFNLSLPWLGLASLYQRNSNQDQALATLQTAAQAVPDSHEIYLRLGEIYLQRCSYTQALESLSIANTLAPTHPLTAYFYSSALQELGHLEEAKEILRHAVIANPEELQLTFAYAEVLSALGENELALPYLESLLSRTDMIQAEPLIAYAQVLLTLIEKHSSNAYKPERAVEALQQAIQIEPDNLHTQALMAEAYAAANNHASALDVYQSLMDTTLIRELYWSSRLAIGMARTALALGKPEVAIASLQDVIQNDLEVSLPYRLIAEAYLAAHLPENALRAAQSAILLKDEDPQTIFWIVSFINQIVDQNLIELSKGGNSSLLNEVLNDSIQTITGIIQTRPEQIGLAINLGELQILTGDTRSARQSLITISHSNYAQSADLIKAAERLFSLEDPQAGINTLLRAVEIETASQGNPSNEVMVKLAEAYAKTGNLQAAQDTFDSAIQREPSNIFLYTAKARLLLTSNQTDKTIECLQQALKMISSTQSPVELHYLFAQAYLKDGNLPSALNHARQSMTALQQTNLYNSEHPVDEKTSQVNPIAVVSLVAELYRMLLQPGLAKNVLGKGREYISDQSQGLPEYIVYYCLSNELDLEADGTATKDLNSPEKSSYATRSPRLLSLNARLAYLQSNCEQAQEFLNAAQELLTSPDNLKNIIASGIDPLENPITNVLAFVEAAIQLRDWESALSSLHKVNELMPSNPLIHLTQARFYILQAEYQDLCQSCSVVRHSPGQKAISESAFRDTRSAFADIAVVFKNSQDELNRIGLSTENNLVDRWQARAELIFERAKPVANAYQKLASSAADFTENPYLYCSDDTSAIVAASRRQNGTIDPKTNIAALFQMARRQAPHSALLLQIAISLSGHHPLEALNASQLSTKFLGQDRRDISAMCHYYQAVLSMQQGMVSEAQEKLNVALSIWNDEPRWNAFAAEIMTQMGDIPGAITHLEEAVKYEPKNIKHHLALGLAYLNGIATNTAADVVIYQKRAIRNLERATRLAPQDAEAWFMLAQAHYQFGEMKESDESIDQVLNIDASNYGGLSLKADIALQSNDFTTACDYAKKAAALQPDRPAAHLILARALESLNRPEEALQALELAIPNTAVQLPLLLERAGLVKQLYGAPKALEELQSITQQFPEDPEVLANLANAYAECDEDDVAIQTAQKSLNSNQEILSELRQAQMHHLLGRLLRKTGQLDQAIMHLHKAAQLVPGDVEPYIELGIAHKERRDYQQALKLFQQATTIATKDPRPFYLAGLALKEGKDYRRSEVMLRKAANLAPQDVNIRRQLAAVVALNLVHNPSTVRVNAE